MLKKELPTLVIGSPIRLPAGLKADNGPVWLLQHRKATQHLEFITQIYRRQIRNGRLFLHEHSADAESRGLPCVRNLRHA